MTLVSAIISDALRESNKIAAGATTPPALATEGLTLFNRIVAAVMGWEVGENLRQWPVGQAGYRDAASLGIEASTWIYPEINVMLVCNLQSAQTIYLPENPSDGARIGVQDLQGNLATYNMTLNGNGRRIEAAQTLVLSTNSLVRSWFYRADLGDWKRFTTLVAGDDFPFPVEFEDWFAMMLALRFEPRLGAKLGQATMAAMKRASRQFTARYVQSQALEINQDLSWPFMSLSGSNEGREFGSTNQFNRGQVY